MKTSELKGADLNYWAAIANGWTFGPPHKIHEWDVWRDSSGEIVGTIPAQAYQPSTDWAIGGPLIDAHDIRFHYPQTSFFETAPDCFVAICGTGMGSKYPMSGTTRLESAMRALVASVFGAEVGAAPAHPGEEEEGKKA